MPWQGPIILSLSWSHGIHVGDLAAPLLFALAFGYVQRTDGWRAPSWPTGRWAVPASAILLGALLAVGGVGAKWISSSSEALLPAGGGVFDGSTVHADARRAVPVNRWSHLALTYDGATLRLYVNGSQVSSRATTGTIKRTTDPLWIGGNHPYGEYFQGLIDQVRVYDRVLLDVRAEMSTPSERPASRAAGLVAAYALDKGSGRWQPTPRAKATPARLSERPGRRRADSVVRCGSTATARWCVPAAASLNLMGPMTLSAWIRPSQPQSGCERLRLARPMRTSSWPVAAPTPGSGHSTTCSAALLVGATIWFCLMLGGGTARGVTGRRRAWPPVALFLADLSSMRARACGHACRPNPRSVVRRAASHRVEAATMYLVTVLFTGLTVASLAGQGGPELARDDGSVARSVALGVLFVAAGLFAARDASFMRLTTRSRSARRRQSGTAG